VNASTAAVARSAAVAIVLILAAALGLVVGTVLDARDGGALEPGARGASMPHVSDFDGAPTYADPYRHLVQSAGRSDVPDTIFPNTWGNIEEADPVTSESWGNIETPARESLTAPTPR
jgi:hypothetical protein